jgi:hypothetical protein
MKNRYLLRYKSDFFYINDLILDIRGSIFLPATTLYIVAICSTSIGSPGAFEFKIGITGILSVFVSAKARRADFELL